MRLEKDEIEIRTRNINKTLSFIGGKWKIKILWNIYSEPSGFNQIKKKLRPISQKVLASELKELEKIGLLNKELISNRPLQYRYTVTELGLSLTPVIKAMCDWGSHI